MKQVLLLGFSGIAIIAGGFYVGFLYIQDPSRSIFFVVGSLVLLLVGLFVVYLAEKKASQVHNTPPTLSSDATETTLSTESVLERNNRMVSEWNNTSEKRDKLQMIKYAAEASSKEKKY